MDEEEQFQQEQPQQPDLAGYPSVDALVAGYRNSSEEGKRQRERADKLEALATQLMSGGPANPRQDVPDRRRRPEDELSDVGVPVAALDRLIADRVQQAWAPVTRGLTARAELGARHPDYLQFEQDVASYIASDPDLSKAYPKMFAADPAGALEYAFLRYGAEKRANSPAATYDPGMVDASIPGTRSGDSRMAPTADSAVEEAFERWQRTGTSRDASAYAKARLRGVISDEFLNQ